MVHCHVCFQALTADTQNLNLFLPGVQNAIEGPVVIGPHPTGQLQKFVDIFKTADGPAHIVSQVTLGR